MTSETHSKSQDGKGGASRVRAAAKDDRYTAEERHRLPWGAEPQQRRRRVGAGGEHGNVPPQICVAP
eukprot:1330835-Rhodomonas_salina.1